MDWFRHWPARLALGLFAMFALAAAAASASVPPALPVPDEAPAAVSARPALWAISDADTTIYLFGTVHTLPPGIGWMRGGVADAFDGSDELVTEIVDGEPAQLQALVVKLALLPEGETLRSLMSDQDRADFEAALAGLGMPASAFDRFDPWFAAIGLVTAPLTRAGFSRENGAETVLNARARARGLPHSGLETAEFQLRLFDSLPIAAQQRYLNEVIAELPKLDTDIAAMISAWRAGDAETLATLMNAQEDDPMLVKALLIDRNRAWAKWIARRLETPGTVFVAVGAGHLAGPGSVQEQLRGRGIASRRVQ